MLRLPACMKHRQDCNLMGDSHVLALKHLQLMSSNKEGSAQLAHLYATKLRSHPQAVAW